MPHTNKLIKELANDPIQFISITDEDPAKIKKFLDKRKLLGWIGIDTKRKSHSAYGVSGIPDTFIIDKSGKLVLRTRPEALTAKLLRSVADGTYVPRVRAKRARSKRKPGGKGALPRVSLGQGGVDPLWSPWIRAGHLSQERGSYFHQTVMRPSLQKLDSWWGGSSTSQYGGGLGITLLGKTVKELLSESMGLASSHFDGTDDETKWDVIYSRPKQSSMKHAWAEVAELVRQATGIKTKLIEREADVLVASVDLTKLQRKKDIDWEGDLTSKSLRSAADLIASFENKSGEYVVHGTKGLDLLYVDTFGVEIWKLSMLGLKEWLEGKGFSFTAEKRRVEFVVINQAGALNAEKRREKSIQNSSSKAASKILGEWDLEIAPDDMPSMNSTLVLKRADGTMTGNLSSFGGDLSKISWNEKAGRLKFDVEPDEELSISFDLTLDGERLVGQAVGSDGISGKVTATKKGAPKTKTKTPRKKSAKTSKKSAQTGGLKPANLDLKVLFVGELGSERTKAFTGFLSQHVKMVTVAPLDGSAPALAKDADVVVLDWQIHRDFEPKFPLGKRALWDKPLVSIGSSYLHLSNEWRLSGGYG